MFHIWEDKTRFSEIFIYIFWILTSHFAAECTVCNTTIELTFEKQIQSDMGGQETVFRNLCGHPSRLDGCQSGFIYVIRVYTYIYMMIYVCLETVWKSLYPFYLVYSAASWLLRILKTLRPSIKIPWWFHKSNQCGRWHQSNLWMGRFHESWLNWCQCPIKIPWRFHQSNKCGLDMNPIIDLEDTINNDWVDVNVPSKFLENSINPTNDRIDINVNAFLYMMYVSLQNFSKVSFPSSYIEKNAASQFLGILCKFIWRILEIISCLPLEDCKNISSVSSTVTLYSKISNGLKF